MKTTLRTSLATGLALACLCLPGVALADDGHDESREQTPIAQGENQTDALVCKIWPRMCGNKAVAAPGE